MGIDTGFQVSKVEQGADGSFAKSFARSLWSSIECVRWSVRVKHV